MFRTYLATNRTGDLKYWTCKSKPDDSIAMEIRLSGKLDSRKGGSYLEAMTMHKIAKYKGLNKTNMASFQPRTARTPYIHIGI